MQSYSLAVALLLSLSSCLFAASSVYVDEPGDFLPVNPTNGMTVTWKPGTPDAVGNLVFGTNAFTSVQSAIDGVNSGGRVSIAAGTYDEGVEITISDSVTLSGDGPGVSILTGASNGNSIDDPGEHPVLQITAAEDGGIGVTLQNMSIVDGKRRQFAAGADGVNSLGADLIIRNCHFSGHLTEAIRLEAYVVLALDADKGPLTRIVDSVFTGNGIGVLNGFGHVGVIRSTISRSSNGIINRGRLNLISSGISECRGSGIYGVTASSTLVYYSTIRDSAEGLTFVQADAMVYSSTISGNDRGIFHLGGQSFALLSSTVTGNDDYLFLSVPDVLIANSIIAGNSVLDPPPILNADIRDTGTIRFEGVNFIGDQKNLKAFRPGIDLSFNSTGIELAELLEPALADNGGPTGTHALVAGSPAINAGDADFDEFNLPYNYLGPGTTLFNPFIADIQLSFSGAEQRGSSFSRPYDGGLDIGAIEANYPILVSGKSCSGSEKSVDIIFNQEVTIADLTQVSLVNTATGSTIASTATLSGTILTITSPAAFTAGNDFSVLIAGSAVTNDFGNSFGVTNRSTLMFPASSNVYVDQAIDFYPPSPAPGDTVIWNFGAPNEVTGLTFGVDAFASVQAGVDAICLNGTVFLAAGIYAEGEQIEITHPVTLQGESPASTIITGGHTHRVFKVSGAGNIVTMDRLTIRDGLVDGEGLPGGGAGIQNNDANLTVTHTMISGNQVTAGGGGGISNIGGVVTVSHSTFADNTATLGGGAIVNASLETGQSPELTVTNSTFSGNAANFLPPTGSFNFNGGGAIYNVDISGGGAAVATVANSTFCENSVLNGEGGGIANIGGTLTVTNSIALGNTSSNASGAQDIASLGSFTNESNLIGLPSGLTMLDVLSPLADFGGLTLTRALSPGSPAIGAGDNSFIPAGVTTDQRGAPRLIGGLDIGAYELTTALIAAANSAQFSHNLTTKILITDLLASITGGMGLPLTLQSTSATAAAGSSIRVTDRFIIYTPAPGQTIGDSFTFIASDGFQTVQGTVQITPEGNGNGGTVNISEIKVEGDSAAIIVAGIPGIVYQLQSSSDMSVWISMGAAVTCPSGGIMTFNDPGPLPETRFYRAVDPANSAP
ncbi:hypothetical protein NT6N_22420 [Oceaniferula spumae]|uniref:SbsA Ig-like domain-containing protein n=1 Tax=Oceaniferula spumae TaxID=2979115 RepID=A0AAT9FMR0_9BACT